MLDAQAAPCHRLQYSEYLKEKYFCAAMVLNLLRREDASPLRINRVEAWKQS